LKNAGKRFEEDFEKSVPGHCVFVRLKDAGGWGFNSSDNSDEGGSVKRFTIKNKCDDLIFDGELLIMAELKSHLGKSIPKKVFRQDKKGRCYQIDELYKEKDKPNTFAGVIFNFRDVEQTWMVHISHVYNFYYADDNGKSFPLAWCQRYGLHVPQAIKKTRYRYDIELLFSLAKGGYLIIDESVKYDG